MLERLRSAVALERDIENLQRLLGVEHKTAAGPSTVLGLALEAYRRDEISRGKFRELAAAVGLARRQADLLLEGAGVDGVT